MQHLYMAVFVEGGQDAALKRLDSHFLSRGWSVFSASATENEQNGGSGNLGQPRKASARELNPLTIHAVKSGEGLPVGFLGRKQGQEGVVTVCGVVGLLGLVYAVDGCLVGGHRKGFHKKVKGLGQPRKITLHWRHRQ